jgi:uncharacterized protein
MKKLFTIILTCINFICLSQTSSSFQIPIDDGLLSGVIFNPKIKKKVPIIIFIAGSGPTDRNGNSVHAQSNCYKLLSDELVKKNIATCRFDKRMVGKSIFKELSEEKLNFDMYVNDVKFLVDFIKQSNEYSQIFILGHSEGSLIGMLACQNNKNISGFISLSGPSISADSILKLQLDSQPKEAKDIIFPLIDTLKNGNTLSNVPKTLYILFRPSVQPYMISWMKYNPCLEIQKLQIPILILQGKSDLQVSEKNAINLSKCNINSRLILFEKTSHTLKIVKNNQENMNSYKIATIPINSEISKQINKFIILNK